jgi:hypothetical protein
MEGNLKVLVSYSLYGKELKFLRGAIKNAQIVERLGQNWTSVFYVGRDVPEWVLNDLRSHGALIRHQRVGWHSNGMFWRFNAINEFEFDYVLIRDVDSRIGNRELDLIEIWINSEKIVHVIRDHPFHAALIMGGLWGASSKIGKIDINWEGMKDYGNERGCDQDFLQAEVWPKVKHSLLELGSSFLTSVSHPWVSKRNSKDGFVGEAFDENEAFDPFLREVLTSSEKSFGKLLIRSVRLKALKIRASGSFRH